MANRCDNCDWENDIEREYCEKCKAPLTTDIFISYSRKDYVVDGKPIANCVISKIKKALEDNHISYWFDEEGIYSGDEFAGIITRAIRTSRIFLFISSINSNQSIWTSNEIATALEYKKIIIPFRLDSSPYNDSIMMKIVSLDRIDCDDQEIAIAKMLRAIRHHIPKKKRVDSSLSEIFQNVKGSAVILDIDDKKIEHILSSDGENLCNGKTSTDTLLQLLEERNTSEYPEPPSDDISVCIADNITPIVMLMGPTGVGKTMTMVRLVQYLKRQGCFAEPDRHFRYRRDSRYEQLCDSFQECINGVYAANRTKRLDSMLIKIMDKYGQSVLQIVDVAGEFYYNEYDSMSIPPFLSQILHSSNPFIWVIMIEPYWRDSAQRKRYVETIQRFKSQFFSPEDKVILVCNKTDKLPFFHSKNKIPIYPLLNQIREEYPGLLEMVVNTNPITRLFRRYSCSIVPFSTGVYPPTYDGRMKYIPSSQNFPNLLWKELTKKQ